MLTPFSCTTPVAAGALNDEPPPPPAAACVALVSTTAAAAAEVAPATTTATDHSWLVSASGSTLIYHARVPLLPLLCPGLPCPRCRQWFVRLRRHLFLPGPAPKGSR